MNIQKHTLMSHYKILRLIQSSSKGGGSEHITFTEDFDSDAGDFVYPGEELDCDCILEDITLPSSFPIEHTLKKV